MNKEDPNEWEEVDARELSQDDVDARTAALFNRKWPEFPKNCATIDNRITRLLREGWEFSSERHRTLYMSRRKKYPRTVIDRSGRLR